MLDTLKRHIYDIGLLPSLISFLIIIPVVGGLPSWCSNSIYVAYIIAIMYIGRYRMKIEALPLFLLIYIPISILIAKPSPVFHPWERFFTFSLLYVSISPMIQSYSARLFRHQLLMSSLQLCVLISIISFFCYFLNINLFDMSNRESFRDGEELIYTEFIGTFSGILRHSMVLGIIAGISIIYLFDIYLRKKSPIVMFMMGLAVMASLFAASRGAIIATIIGILYGMSKNLGIKRSLIKIIYATAIIVVLVYPFINKYVDDVIYKHENVETGIYDTRTEKIEFRLSEFKNSPIIGIGFASIDTEGDDRYDIQTGTIEPGSSWLAALSMTGIVGFLLFASMACHSYRMTCNPTNFLQMSLLLFFFVKK